jgi:hypothetical protein
MLYQRYIYTVDYTRANEFGQVFDAKAKGGKSAAGAAITGSDAGADGSVGK